MNKKQDPNRCKERVMDGWLLRNCSRKPWKDGYCKQHHPDAVKKRADASRKRFKEQQANSVYGRLERLHVAHEAALERIKELEATIEEITEKTS